MRNGQNNNKRMRGRNRRGHNPMTRVYESNGPDVKIRGTAHHIAEKYAQLARDAQSSGDPVAAEGYLQHAEHYYRLIMAAQVQFAQQNPHAQPQQPFQRPDMDGRDDFDDDGDDTGEQPMQGGQPLQNGAPNQQMQRPQHQPQPQQHQPQPNFQGYQRRDDEQRDAGLPAFITGGGAPQPQGNGGENEQGDRGDRGDRFGRRRRRFRPRGPNDMEQRGEGSPDTGAPSGEAAKPGE
ncbi:MAG TPA: DUF4167 domain-containing protein [Xanthobacteraceae bacterium]|nr:DUF4167 domain-containing protein [Xanthobacteraceae bacterium]